MPNLVTLFWAHCQSLSSKFDKSHQPDVTAILTGKQQNSNVTRWLYYFSIFGHLDHWKFAQEYKIFAKLGSQFCQVLNSYPRNVQKLFKNLPKWRNFAKSGHAPPLPGLRLSGLSSGMKKKRPVMANVRIVNYLNAKSNIVINKWPDWAVVVV